MGKPLGVALLGTKHAHAAGKMAVLRESEKWDVIGACEPDEGESPWAALDDLLPPKN